MMKCWFPLKMGAYGFDTMCWKNYVVMSCQISALTH